MVNGAGRGGARRNFLTERNRDEGGDDGVEGGAVESELGILSSLSDSGASNATFPGNGLTGRGREARRWLTGMSQSFRRARRLRGGR